ncbi:hypothetical protein BASA61_007299 [Batrachochytrium salamandrivorans]|nr:hypothetical protein BASA62_006478 [Batrachochytrium salamandrivorans]KAH6568708.1 hypothetical protein BASA60_008513 [Batrachochytrium salamandrivorans]KAH6584730.1 hypothetical protein BASA61_007299 [Batrachochytrium salamandrivorans]
MLSRLIITFLCAAAIGSVSGAFLTFDPELIDVKDIEATISFSAKLNSKPTEAVTVYFENPLMSLSTCMIVFNPNNWNVPQEITGVLAPLLVGPPSSLPPLDFESELLAKAVTVSPLPAELSTIDTLKITRGSTSFYFCFIKKNEAKTFDEIPFSFHEPGWYQMVSTRDIEVQAFVGECPVDVPCIKKVVVRYGSSAMSLDVSGPVKNLREYSVTKVTQNTNEIHVDLVKNGDIVFLEMYVSLDAEYTSPGGFCNRPRPHSPDNKLIGSDDKLYDPTNENDAAIFVDSWGVRDEDVLTNPGARTLNPPALPGTVCKFPEKPRPNPTTTTTTTVDLSTTTSTTTVDFSTYVSSFTVDLSESTLAPTITYALSSTTITTSPSTTSTTSPYLPDPPAPGGYVPPPPPKPGVVDEIQRCPKPARI